MRWICLRSFTVPLIFVEYEIKMAFTKFIFRSKIISYVFIGISVYTVMVYLISTKVITSVADDGIYSAFWRVVTSNRSRDIPGFGTIALDVTSVRRYFKQTSIERLPSINEMTNMNASITDILQECSQGNTRTLSENMLTKNILSEDQSINQFLGKNFECTHLMTLSGSLGRTGNQMFQFAALLGTAHFHGYTPFLKPSFPLARWFRLPNLETLEITNMATFSDKQCSIYSNKIQHLEHSKNWTLSGYFQSWKYFKDAKGVVRESFKLKAIYLDEARLFLSNVSKKGNQNVCVHVRRGDINSSIQIRKGYAIADLGFIYRAMDFYRNKFKAAQFIVLSDGMDWCKDNIEGSDVIFSPFYQPATDMALMTLCDHVVVTSGTFGWWGAWLAGGTTVYFRGYPRKGSWLESQVERRDYYPNHWIGLL